MIEIGIRDICGSIDCDGDTAKLKRLLLLAYLDRSGQVGEFAFLGVHRHLDRLIRIDSILLLSDSTTFL